MNYKGIGRATGKIILMGEHAVVYGKPAIALPFYAARIETEVNLHDGKPSIDCIYYAGNLEEAPAVLKGVKTLIKKTLMYLKRENQGVHIDIRSELPAQRGLGSSAAVAVSIVRALFDAFDETLDDGVLCNLVNVAEQIHHTNPSGLDASTISKGQPVFFERNKQNEYLDFVGEGTIVVADTGELGETKVAVADFGEALEANPTLMQAKIDRIHALTLAVREAIKHADLDLIGAAMNETHEILRAFTVSNETLDRFVSAAINAGALGAKLTGSGRGGCMIALVRNQEDGKRVEAALREAGAVQTWEYNLKEMINYDENR